MPSMRVKCSAGPSQTPSATPNPTEPMLKNVDAIAGTPNRFDAFSTPMACAASATSSRNGNMMRVMVTASSNFPGTAEKPGANRRTSAGAKIMPAAHRLPTSTISAVATRFARRAASALPRVARYSVKVGTKALESAPSANRSRVRLGMRNPSMNASYTKPAPNRRAMMLSRSRPVIRLVKTESETTPAERTSRSACALELARDNGSPRESPSCSEDGAGSGRVTSLPVLFKEVGNRHDPRIVVFEFVFFVGRMQSIVGQAETHEDGGDSQMRGEVAHNGDGPSAAYEHGLAPKDVGESFRGHADRWMIRIDADGRRRAQDADAGLNAGRRVVLYELFECRHDFVRFLIRNQPHADLRGGLCGDYGLRSRRRITAGDAVHFQRGPRPGALEYGISRLAGQLRRPNFFL